MGSSWKAFVKFNHTDVGSISCPWNSVMMPESPETSNNYTPEKSKLKHLMNPTLMTTVFSSIHYSNSVNMYHIYHTLVKPVLHLRTAFGRDFFFSEWRKSSQLSQLFSPVETIFPSWKIASMVGQLFPKSTHSHT